MSETIGRFEVTVDVLGRKVSIQYEQTAHMIARFEHMPERDLLDLQYVLKRTLAELHGGKKA